ncbi:1,2-phenylacetyl-CoA epoxidase subunit PaaE [Acetobacter senegalensis]|uniref:1,2-phenylacetyl-CoA epoxidase subunit PaaE n=1 Tax=Acetobacter senegalensis TaxID=446692 RepID=UPI002651902A|nr:1,2-phenylacetyl-CoA epoxidase subunit PaaE [Acetobacter senegalensis]MDN7352767.1 1,2-phenylacetyl-CoA epoxidase subunit PaaE [Acetobacter senegalensis]
MSQTDILNASSAQVARTARFHKLQIADVRRETPDAVSLAFTVPDDLAEAYSFVPGQYLTLRTKLDGEDVRRSYSICSAPSDGELRVALKRVEDGVFSTWANTSLAAGDSLDVMTPTGRFGIQPDSTARRVYAGFAAGSGITPVLSLARGLLATEPDSSFFLFYGNRSVGDMLFREMLEDLKDQFMERFSIFHVFSKEQQDIPALNGRLDAEKIRTILLHVLPTETLDHVFVCGPSGMTDDALSVLQDAGVAEDKIHIERFISTFSGKPRLRQKITSEQAAQTGVVATLIVDGKRADVNVAEEETLLDAALRSGLDLPYACKGGMCSTCRAKVTEGKAEMTLNFSLEKWEVDAGFVLTCQAHPTTEHVTVDYDAM